MDKHFADDRSTKIIKVVSTLFITLFALLCLFPFLLMISSSLMNEHEIITEGYKLFPTKATTLAYHYLLRDSNKLLDSYKTTIFITVFGTCFGLIIMSMAGYVLNRKDFKYRNFFAFFFYFTTLFSGGLVPSYMLMVNVLHLKDSVFAMILPGLASAWSIFLMRNFLKSIPDSLYESATIDGAGPFTTYLRIYMPLAKPALATVGLFQALGYWNEWYNAMLYIESKAKYPLQYYLQKMVNSASINNLISEGFTIDTSQLPTQSIKMATAVVSIGPIIFVYPFVQKYFVGGMTIGSVKG